MQEVKNIGQRKTMLLAQRNIQSIVGRGSLQLKVERAAETLTERETPGFVDAPAKRRVDDKLHASAFVEKAFGDDGGLGWDLSQDPTTSKDVFDYLFGASVVQTTFNFQPTYRGRDLWRELPDGIGNRAGNKRTDFFS